VLAQAEEKTWKETVISYPDQVTRIIVKFENAGQFVWHCHIIEHEDHDMMRPMQVQ
jgi:FtsP/CotA-like multicopper oxidase with cupredoxin domain